MNQSIIKMTINVEELDVVRKWYRQELGLLRLCKTDRVVDLEDYASLRQEIKKVKIALDGLNLLKMTSIRRKDPEIRIGAYPPFFETFHEVMTNQRLLIEDWLANAECKTEEKLDLMQELGCVLVVYRKVIRALS